MSWGIQLIRCNSNEKMTKSSDLLKRSKAEYIMQQHIGHHRRHNSNCGYNNSSRWCLSNKPYSPLSTETPNGDPNHRREYLP